MLVVSSNTEHKDVHIFVVIVLSPNSAF
jgi:hypothetical protein